MSHIEITPDLLAIIKLRAVAYEESKASPRRVLDYNRKNYLKATKPAVVLPLVDKVERLQQANKDLLARLESMAAQHACGCGHPACKRCEDDKLNQEVIARAKGGAE